LALTCLYTLQGIPCLYYGTEQGFAGAGPDRESVRECLWRSPTVFSQDPQHDFYRLITQLVALRNAQPALRYGRQYFRPLTGNGIDFAYSPFAPGCLAYSRILNDRELVIAANTDQANPVDTQVLVDRNLQPSGARLRVLVSNLPRAGGSEPGFVRSTQGGAVIPVTLRPMEAWVLG
jgi:glycosidase